MKKTLWTLFFTLTLTLTASGRAGERDSILLVALGGRTSCRSNTPKAMDLYKPFKNLLKEIETQRPLVQIHYVVGCLNSDAPPLGSGRYLTSDAPDTILSGNTAAIRSEMENLVSAHPGMPLFIMGHSYGGWMSMYLTTQLAEEVKIDALFSIDPIGIRCGPSGYLTGSPECKKAPTDLNHALIKERVEVWENIYQNQDSWLHSSEIEVANNHLLDFRGPHGQIDTDKRTWEIIRKDILKQLP